MKPHPEITYIQTAIDHAWKSWRSVPDGRRYQILTRQLGIFVQAVVRDAIKDGKATLTTTIPHVGRVFITVIETHGRRTIANLSHVTDFDEVVNDYLAWLCNRYILKPDTQYVQSPAYIRMGIVMRAYALERRLKNSRHRETTKDKPDATPMVEKRPPVLNRLKTLWFYPHGDDPAPKAIPVSFQGLSLRYLYTALRYNAGVSLSTTAAELGIHASRLTDVKKEYARLFPGIQSGAWLNFPMDYKPICVAEPMLLKLNLKGVHRRYSLLKSTDDKRVQQEILQSKHILWHLLQFASNLVCKEDLNIPETSNLKVPGKNNLPDTLISVKQDHNHMVVMDFWSSPQKKRSVVA